MGFCDQLGHHESFAEKSWDQQGKMWKEWKRMEKKRKIRKKRGETFCLIWKLTERHPAGISFSPGLRQPDLSRISKFCVFFNP